MPFPSLLYLLKKGIEELFFLHCPYHFPFPEEDTDAFAACNADISLPRLTGTVHHTSHDRYSEGFLTIPETVLDL